MNSISLTITTKEEKGVLDEITDILSSHGINISYVHLYVKDDVGTLNLELDHVEKLDELIDELESKDFILDIEIHGSLNDIFGKRVLIFGGGAQVSQVAVGAITEADRHNIRGERISVDTIPLVGEENIAEITQIVIVLETAAAFGVVGRIQNSAGNMVADRVFPYNGLAVSGYICDFTDCAQIEVFFHTTHTRCVIGLKLNIAGNMLIITVQILCRLTAFSKVHAAVDTFIVRICIATAAFGKGGSMELIAGSVNVRTPGVFDCNTFRIYIGIAILANIVIFRITAQTGGIVGSVFLGAGVMNAVTFLIFYQIAICSHSFETANTEIVIFRITAVTGDIVSGIQIAVVLMLAGAGCPIHFISVCINGVGSRLVDIGTCKCEFIASAEREQHFAVCDVVVIDTRFSTL